MLMYDKLKRNFKILIKKSVEDDIFALSSQLSYSLLLSFFPFLIFLITLISYSNIKVNDILLDIRIVAPRDVYSLVYKIVMQVVHKRNSGLLSFSFILSVWSAASGFNAVIKGLNKAYDEDENRSYIYVQAVCVVFTAVFAFVIMFFVFSMLIGQSAVYILADYLGIRIHFYFIWNVLKYIFIIIFMTFVFGVLYIYAPSKRKPFIKVLPGALISSAAWLISSFLFSFYINNFSNYAVLYGSIGAVIVLMLWLLVTSFMLILGGEINSVIMKNN